MRFNIERARLDRAADFVPPQDLQSSPTELVPLTEDAGTLDLLFRFVYCERHVSLEGMSFERIAALAEAAEKYLVYSAMAICHIYMKAQYKAHPLEFMQYAIRHYPELVDTVAPYTVGNELVIMKDILPGGYVVPWVLFNTAYYEIAQHTTRWINKHLGHYGPIQCHNRPCALGEGEDEAWGWLERELAHALLTTGGRGLLDLDKVFTDEMMHSLERCEGCQQTLRLWKKELERVVGEVPKFTSFL